MSMTDLRWKEKHLDQMRKDYEAMSQARQDARDTIRWRLAMLKRLEGHDWSWMKDMPPEIKAQVRQCLSDIEDNLDASWSEA